MRDLHSDIADQIIEQLEQFQDAPHGATLPWNHPEQGIPTNSLTKRPYRGSNFIILMVQAVVHKRLSSKWATYKQWNELGGQVRKGEKSVRILVPMIFKDEPNDDDEGKVFMRFKTGYLFNEDQVDIETDASVLEAGDDLPVLPQEAADELIKATGAEIITGGYRAYFAPESDHIQMPDLERFTGTKSMDATEGWYSTLLHELVHWTGHKDRLNREGVVGERNEKNVAVEELIAEFGSAFLCVRTGITPTIRDDHREYISSWIAALKDDYNALFRAAAAADKAADYVYAFQDADEEVNAARVPPINQNQYQGEGVSIA